VTEIVVECMKTGKTKKSCFECFWISPGKVRTRLKGGDIREPHRECEFVKLNPAELEAIKQRGTNLRYLRYGYPIYESNAEDLAKDCPKFRWRELGDFK